MPIPKHFRITFRGVFRNTPEAWSHGVHMQQTNNLASDAHLGDVNMATLLDAWGILAATGGPAVPSSCQLMDIRAYEIGTDGHAIGNVKIFDTSAGGVFGNTAPKYPFQIALVATTVALNRGPAKLGRMYLPTSTTVGADGRISQSDALACAVRVADFLKKCSDAIDLPDTVESAAAVNVSTRGGPDGTLQSIDHVEVGRVLDTMRSRRTSLLEEREHTETIDW